MAVLISFDELIERKIGFGKYQFLIAVLLSFMSLAEGMEVAVLSLLLPVLSAEWAISEIMQSILGSSLFIGMLIGSFISGFLSDKYGRKKAIQNACLAEFIIGLVTLTVNEEYTFCLMRILLGLLIGFLTPILPALCVENVPLTLRGKAMVWINTFFSIGLIVGNTIGWYCLDDLTHGNWRLMIGICSLLPFFVWLGTSKYMHESARFELIIGHIDEGIEILSNVGKFNYGDGFMRFSEIEREIIIMWAKEQKILKENLIDKVTKLFKSEYRIITIALWILWFASNFVYYGLVFILPFFLSHYDDNPGSKDGIIRLIITTIGETSAVFPTLMLIETNYFGRKYTIVWSLILTFLLCIATYYSSFGGSLLTPCLALGRFFLKICMAASLSFTAELYSTFYRTIGMALATTMGKIGLCIMPPICLSLYYENEFSPFRLFAILLLLSAIATMFIAYDTQGRFLDIKTTPLITSQEMNEVNK